MSTKCAKCSEQFVTSEVPLKCMDCASSFHPACTREGSEPNFRKSKLKSWKCDTCKGETLSLSSNDEASNLSKTFLDALQTLKLEINSNTDKNINEVKESLKSLKSDLVVMNNRLQTLEDSQEDLKTKCVQLEHDRSELRAEVGELRLKVIDSEQHSRCANIEVQGLPQTNGEDVYSLLGAVAKTLGIEYSREDLSMAHRLRLYSQKHRHAPIIAQFTSRRVKEVWMSAARSRKGFTAQEVSASFPKTAVYVNDHLTAHNKMLLGRARRLKREGKIYQATFVNGKVLVRAKEGDSATRVFVVEDLDKYTN